MKKYLVFFLSIFLFLGAKAQVTPITYTPMNAAGYQMKYLKPDSGFALPVIDTTIGRGVDRPGLMVINPVDSLPYYYNGKLWKPVYVDSTGVIELINGKVDSVTVNGNTLFYWVAGLGYGQTLNKLDSIHVSSDSVFTCIAGTCTFSYLTTAGTGTITQIIAGFGLNPDTITASGTIAVDTSVFHTSNFNNATYAPISHTHAASDIISGVFPIVRGGTGLSGIGSVGQSLRVASSGTALEYFTPADSSTFATIHRVDSIAGLKANDSGVVHKAGTETITGAKTFNSDIVENGVINFVTGSSNIFELSGTPFFKTRYSNTLLAIGYDAGLNNQDHGGSGTPGFGNTFFGAYAGVYDTVGRASVGIGTYSLYNYGGRKYYSGSDTALGSDMTFGGYNSAYTTTSGASSAGWGNEVGYNIKNIKGSTLIGAAAADMQAVGTIDSITDLTAIGVGAVQQQKMDSSIAIGSWVGDLGTGGVDNILIGDYAGRKSAGNLSNTTILGHNTYTYLNNIAAIGSANQDVIIGADSTLTDWLGNAGRAWYYSDNGDRLQVNGNTTINGKIGVRDIDSVTTPSTNMVSWNSTTHRFQRSLVPSGGGGNTIYTADDSLTGDRYVYINHNKLDFGQVGFQWLELDAIPTEEGAHLFSTDTTDFSRFATVSMNSNINFGYNVGMEATYGTNDTRINVDAVSNAISFTSGTNDFTGDVKLESTTSGSPTDSILVENPSTHVVGWRDASSFLNISDTASMLSPYSKIHVTSYGKNATGDSTILVLSDGTRYAAKDSVGAGSSTWSTLGSDIFYKAGKVNVGSGIIGTGELNVADSVLAASGSLAGSALNVSQTWNTTGSPTMIFGNVTNQASGSASKLIDLQVGGVSQFNVSKAGIVKVLGYINLGSNANTTFGPTANGNSFSSSGTDVLFAGSNSSNANSTFSVYSGNRTNTSGTSGVLNLQGNSAAAFSPTSGTGVFNTINIADVINQTGGANGITRGIYIHPTLTAAADYRAIELTNNTGKGIYQTGTADNLFFGKLKYNTKGTFTDSTGADSNTVITVTGAQRLMSGGSGTTTNAVTFNNAGSGDASGTTFNGSAARTISYNTLGAAPLASPGLTGTPTAPTPATSDSSTKVATTALIKQLLSTSNLYFKQPLKYDSATNTVSLDTANMPGLRPYKVYTATLKQTSAGADPTVTVLENTTGTTITWTFSSTGALTGLAGVAVFTSGKSFIEGQLANSTTPNILHYIMGSGGSIVGQYSNWINSTTQLSIDTWDGSHTSADLYSIVGATSSIVIEIRIYP